MSRETEFWGRLAEAAVRELYGLERERCSYYDAVTPEGQGVESKTCRLVLANGRKGRIWIERESHEKRLEEDVLYALSVYDPQRWRDGPILDVKLMPAVEIDGLVSWTGSGTGHHCGEEHAKLGWPHVLDGEVARC